MKKVIEQGQFIVDIDLKEGTINRFLQESGMGKTYLKFCVDQANEVMDTEIETITYNSRDTLDNILDLNPKLIIMDRLDLYYDDFKSRLSRINEYISEGGIVLLECNLMEDDKAVEFCMAFVSIRADKQTGKPRITASNDIFV